MKSRLRTVSGIVAAVLVCGGVFPLANANEVTLKGEILDLHCYLLHGEDGAGEEHAKCAEVCIKKGLAAGFLSVDGGLYLLLGPGHDSPKELVAERVGKPVTLRGDLVEVKGLKSIQVKSVN